MPEQITVKAHEWHNSASPWVQFTIYSGVFPLQTAVAYAHEHEIADTIAKALARSLKAPIVWTKGPPDRDSL